MPATEREMLASPNGVWPALPQAAWSDSCATLQLWLQVVGKVRLALLPAINHTRNLTLYPTVPRATTSPLPRFAGGAAGCRESAAGVDAGDQSHLERHTLPDSSRCDHFADATRHAYAANRFRFCAACFAAADQQWRQQDHSAKTYDSRLFLSASNDGAR